VEDYLSLLPTTLQWISNRLGSISTIPWPLWIGRLVSFVCSWGVGCRLDSCAVEHGLYDVPIRRQSEPSVSELGTGRVVKVPSHNRRAYYRYGHSVNTAVRRWQNFAKDGSIVNRRESGFGVLRLRPSGHTLLYEQGYVRPPMDVVALSA